MKHFFFKFSSIRLGCLFLLPLQIFFAGCVATPNESVTRNDLRGQCFAMFMYPRFEGDQPAGLYQGRIGYQYWGEKIKIKAFAIGVDDKDGQVCAYFMQGAESGANMESVKMKAIQTCNSFSKGTNTCVIYAIGDQTIVYDRLHHTQLIQNQKNALAQRLKVDQELKQNSAQAPAISNKQPSIDFNTAKIKCAELGFKESTEGFGKCVLQLTK